MNIPNIDPSIVPTDTPQLSKETGNIYESLVIVAKRANQIGTQLKNELNEQLAEFAVSGDNLEEIVENREQIEIARRYDALPKPTLLALQEFLDAKVYYTDPNEE